MVTCTWLVAFLEHTTSRPVSLLPLDRLVEHVVNLPRVLLLVRRTGVLVDGLTTAETILEVFNLGCEYEL
jgi:hypothetical protein